MAKQLRGQRTTALFAPCTCAVLVVQLPFLHNKSGILTPTSTECEPQSKQTLCKLQLLKHPSSRFAVY